MLDKEVTLITILKDTINNYEEKMQELQNVNNSALYQNQTIIEEFRKDVSVILDIDISILKRILEEADTSIDEENEIIEYLNSIKSLLTLNKEKNTTYELQDSQLKYVDIFFDKVEIVYGKNNKIQKSNLKSVGKISKVCDQYRHLLELIENNDKDEFINNMSLIERLLKENSINDEDTEKILFELLNYNKDTIERIVDEKEKRDISHSITKDELQELFLKYHYDIDLLDNKFINELIRQGNLWNMELVFQCLESLNIPSFDIKNEEESAKLVILLLVGNYDVISNIVQYSIQKNLTIDNLLTILPVLIAQDKKIELLNINITGKSDDYIQNVELLESLGYSLEDVYNHCKTILVMSNKHLVENYRTYKEYGFDLVNNNNLLNPSLSYLTSKCFKEVLEQVIEIMPEGYRYISNNLEQLSRITSYDDIVLYNIYASYMDHNEFGETLTKEGPFVNNNSDKLKLRSEITRYIGSGYERIPYRDIEDNNKMEKTETIIPSMDNYDMFMETINKAKELDLIIPDMISGDTRLSFLDNYIDKECNLRYYFDGVYISVLKVKRIFNILKYYHMDTYENSILFSIIYHSILNEDSFQKISNIINNN